MDLFAEYTSNLSWRTLVDIALVALLFYQIISMLRGTRTAQVLIGMLVIFFAYLVSSVLQFETLNWIISKFYSDFILVIVILFQDDIRRLLTRFGKGPFMGGIEEDTGATILDEVVSAVHSLSHDRIGAIIVFERAIGLDRLYDRSVRLDALLTEPLLVSIFQTFSPLHDGAVIVRKNRIICASAHLPLSKRPVLSRKLGTRHSAALGITEETDAVVIVVSEETGVISLSHGGRLEKQSSPKQTRENLQRLLLPSKDSRKSHQSQKGSPLPGQGTSTDATSASDQNEILKTLPGSPEAGLGSELGADLHEDLQDSYNDKPESTLLQDLRKLKTLDTSEKFDPPLPPPAPPTNIDIGGVSVQPAKRSEQEEEK